MTIAVLGWGSLIWNHGSLPLGSGWFADGPKVPLEFARESKDGRLTLVVHGEKSQQVLWSKLDVSGKSEAIEALRKREGTLETHIGWRFGEDQSSGKYSNCHKLDIADWLKSKGLKGVVWTALPSKWNNENGNAPDLKQAINYVKGLRGVSRDLALEYIRNAPVQIKTPYRAEFEEHIPELID